MRQLLLQLLKGHRPQIVDRFSSAMTCHRVIIKCESFTSNVPVVYNSVTNEFISVDWYCLWSRSFGLSSHVSTSSTEWLSTPSASKYRESTSLPDDSAKWWASAAADERCHEQSATCYWFCTCTLPSKWRWSKWSRYLDGKQHIDLHSNDAATRSKESTSKLL